MNYNKTKIILYVWITIFIAMTFFVVYGFYTIVNKEQYVDSLEEEIIKENKSIQSYQSLVKTSLNLKTDSEKVNTYFIKRDEVINFINKIESLASTTNTQILIQTVTEKKIEVVGKVLSVDISASGSYSNLYYLIKLLEELPYQTEIQNIKLLNGSPVEGGASWSASITIAGAMF